MSDTSFHPLQVQIQRVAGFTALSPVTITVNAPERVQELFTVMTHLPVLSTAYTSASLGRGLQYQLHFVDEKGQAVEALCHATGNQRVVLQNADYRKPDEHFWTLVEQALGEPVFESTWMA